jgi:hypothetical protein
MLGGDDVLRFKFEFAVTKEEIEQNKKLTIRQVLFPPSGSLKRRFEKILFELMV